MLPKSTEGTTKKFATKDNYIIITCGVRCHNKVVSRKTVTKGKSSSLEGSKKKTDDSGSNKYTSWHSDNPSKQEKTSMNILLSWPTTEGNYSQYKGGYRNKGETKIVIAKELNLKILHSGCIVMRDPKQIANKINKLVWQYRDAIALRIVQNNNICQKMIWRMQSLASVSISMSWIQFYVIICQLLHYSPIMRHLTWRKIRMT
jgi:hypothetical protein